MYRDLNKSERAQIVRSNLRELCGEQRVLGYGALVICRKGEMDMNIDFKSYRLMENTIIILFPGDILQVNEITEDFEVEMLRYDKALLREASLQLEQTVYSRLRKDRCRGGDQVILEIFEAIFRLLRLHFDQKDCQCKEQLVLYQLKSFFLGFYDYLRRHNDNPAQEARSQRVNELFTAFMEALEINYERLHNVSDYAQILSISSKYLYNVSMEVSGQSPKAIIDHYVIMQIKLNLRTTDTSIKELAWQYHFSDASFLCRYFRQHTDMSPQEYRRIYRDI